jgi:hypothetical protein
MITLSYPYFLKFSKCSNVKTEPQITGCPNLFPKSLAPFEALDQDFFGVWYNQSRSSWPVPTAGAFQTRI